MTFHLKGTVSVNSNDPPCNDDNDIIETLISSKNVKETVVFLTRREFISVSFPLLFMNKKCASLRNFNENIEFKESKTFQYLIQ